MFFIAHMFLKLVFILNALFLIIIFSFAVKGELMSI